MGYNNRKVGRAAEENMIKWCLKIMLCEGGVQYAVQNYRRHDAGGGGVV